MTSSAQGPEPANGSTVDEQGVGGAGVNDSEAGGSPLGAGRANGSNGANRLHADAVTLAYDQRVISSDLSVQIPNDSFTVIIGPNACGKSTLLRSLSRLLKPQQGQVVLDGKALVDYRPKEAARSIGLLPQTSIAPEGIKVADLVSRGRFPHQGMIRAWRPEDERAVNEAMSATGVAPLAGRLVAELSGGQRQRVWAAMALAQETPILLLDEPTTYLDISFQIELLDLFESLNERGTTIVAVLHDLGQATRYATHLIAMKAGKVVAEGAPAEIVTAELVEEVYGLPCAVITDPISGTPLVLPKGAKHR